MSNSNPDGTNEANALKSTLKSHHIELDEQADLAQKLARASQRDADIELTREVGAPATQAEQPSVSGRERPHRLLLIGLDGATPELALGAWRSQLHTLAGLAERGVWGTLQSSIPWTGIPAWLCLFSGHDPDQLGIYGAQQRVNRGYTATETIDSRAIGVPRLWDILGTVGKNVGVIGAHATTPVQHVHGMMVGDRLERSVALTTYPRALKQQIDMWLEDAGLLQHSAPDRSPEQLIQELYTQTEQRFTIARRLLARDVYDCFVLVDRGMRILQRVFWHVLDTAHPYYQPNHPLADVIGAFYRFIDSQLSDLIEMVDNDTVVAIVSACGAQPLRGELALNEWLLASGDLVLQSAATNLTTLDQCAVDWERTHAWADDSGAIYLNVADREPQGLIPAQQIAHFGAGIAERLRTLRGPDGQLAIDVHVPDPHRAAHHGIVPDLLAVCKQAGWRTTGRLGFGRVWVAADETQPDRAWESPSGFLVMHDPRNLGGGRQLDQLTIYDLMPTFLELFDLPHASGMHGKIIPGL